MKTSERHEPFVARYLPYLLAQAAERLTLPFHRMLKDRGFRESEWRVLATLFDAREGMGVSELAAHVLVPQSTLSRRLDRMAERQLIERRVRDDDRRGITVTLTDTGRTTARNLMLLALAQEEADTEQLKPEEVRTLKRLLARLAGAD